MARKHLGLSFRREDRPLIGPALLLPLILTALVYLSTSGFRAVIDYDEGYYSQAALHMARSGDWVTPYVNGVRFLEKPPLMYWVTAASLRLFGVHEFALRFPTALGVLALVWTVMRMARRTASDRVAIVAGLCTAFSAGVYLFTREALHDIWLALFVTLALHAFLEWYLDPRRSLRHALLFYTALAGAVMTKSLIGAAFPVGIGVVFFLFCRERPKWRDLHPLPGALLFLALTVPWHALATLRNEGFLWSFFMNEQLLRFFGKHDPPIVWSVPLVTFWALIPVWFFPWTAFLPAAFADCRKACDPKQRALVRLVLAWLVVILGFYSISARLEHYALPLLPALALLVGWTLGRRDAPKSVTWGFRGLALLGVAILVVGAGLGLWFSATGSGFENAASARAHMIEQTDFSILAEMPVAIQLSLMWPAAITILSLAGGFLAAWWLERRRLRMPAVMSLAIAAMILCAMIHWSLILCEDMISSRKFGSALAREASPGDHLVIVGDMESANSLAFYQPLPMEIYDGVAYSLIPGMKYPDAPRIVLTLVEFETLWKGEGRVYVLLPSARGGELKLEGIEILQVMDRTLIRNR